MKNMHERLDQLSQDFGQYLDARPSFREPYESMAKTAYADGALSTRHKRLMAMVGAMVAGCEGCTLFQSRMALKHGATVEEFLEAIAVAVSLGGTMASSKSTLVVRYLTEEGLLERHGQDQ